MGFGPLLFVLLPLTIFAWSAALLFLRPFLLCVGSSWFLFMVCRLGPFVFLYVLVYLLAVTGTKYFVCLPFCFIGVGCALWLLLTRSFLHGYGVREECRRVRRCRLSRCFSFLCRCPCSYCRVLRPLRECRYARLVLYLPGTFCLSRFFLPR